MDAIGFGTHYARDASRAALRVGAIDAAQCIIDEAVYRRGNAAKHAHGGLAADVPLSAQPELISPSAQVPVTIELDTLLPPPVPAQFVFNLLAPEFNPANPPIEDPFSVDLHTGCFPAGPAIVDTPAADTITVGMPTKDLLYEVLHTDCFPEDPATADTPVEIAFPADLPVVASVTEEPPSEDPLFEVLHTGSSVEPTEGTTVEAPFTEALHIVAPFTIDPLPEVLLPLDIHIGGIPVVPAAVDTPVNDPFTLEMPIANPSTVDPPAEDMFCDVLHAGCFPVDPHSEDPISEDLQTGISLTDPATEDTSVEDPFTEVLHIAAPFTVDPLSEVPLPIATPSTVDPLAEDMLCVALHAGGFPVDPRFEDPISEDHLPANEHTSVEDPFTEVLHDTAVGTADPLTVVLGHVLTVILMLLPSLRQACRSLSSRMHAVCARTCACRCARRRTCAVCPPARKSPSRRALLKAARAERAAARVPKVGEAERAQILAAIAAAKADVARSLAGQKRRP